MLSAAKNINHLNSKQTRNSNLELLRIVSIILIIAMHTIGYASSKGGELSTSNECIRFLIGAFGNLGVGCFVLISGYFGVKYTTRKFLYIIWMTTIYTMICAWANNDFSLDRSVIMAIISVPRYFNWYITCYLILMSLSGYLNRFAESLSRQEFKRLLIILCIFFSILPMMVSATETVLLKTGQCLTYFIYAYLIGRYIHQYQDIEISRQKCIIIVFSFVTTVFLIKIIGIFILSLNAIPIMSNNSPLILGAVIGAFYLFKSFRFKSNVINYISSSVLAAYLLDSLRPAIDKYIQVYIFNQSNEFSLYVVIETVSIFTIAIIIDKLRITIFKKGENYILGTLSHYFNRSVCKLTETFQIH